MITVVIVDEHFILLSEFKSAAGVWTGHGHSDNSHSIRQKDDSSRAFSH